MIEVKNHQIYIHGIETFLYGAEFHYFRADKSVWEERLQQIRDSGFNLVSTYVPWIVHEIEEEVFDFTGETDERRDLASFLSLCDRMGLYCIVRPGPYVMSELINAGLPLWLLKNYPEILARDKAGQVHPTQVVTYLHDQYLKLAARWYEQVCAVIAPHLITHGGNVLMFQLDNEIGMLHWVSNTSDYSEHSVAGFTQFLEQKYEKIESLQSALGIPATDFTKATEQLLQDADLGLKMHWLWVDYRRKYAVDYVQLLKDLAQKNGIDVPFIVNVHGFKDFSIYSRGTDYPIGLSQLRDVSEIEDVVIAGDFYPGHIGYDNFHDLVLSSVLTEAISRPDQVLFSAEFQSGRLSDRPRVYPQDVDLITRICVSQGMNALNYYMFSGGQNMPGIGLFGKRHEWQAPIAASGALRPSYQVTKHLGKLYQTWGRQLSAAKKQIDLSLGFYSPYYATETVDRQNPEVQKVIATLSHYREHFHFDGIWRLLAKSNVAYDAVDLAKGVPSPKHCPLLWVASTPYMDAKTQTELVAYVQAGGRLVIGPDLPLFDLTGASCTVLSDQIGAHSVGSQHGTTVSVLGMEDVFAVYHHALATKEDVTVLITGSGEHKDVVAGFSQIFGEGQVIVLGIAFSDQFNYYQEMLMRLLADLHLVPTLQTVGDPVFASLRHGDKGSFLSLINPEPTLHHTQVYKHGVVAFGGHAIMVPANGGKFLPQEVQLQPGLRLSYTTVEITELQVDSDQVALTVFILPGDTAYLKVEYDANWRLLSAEDFVASSTEIGLYSVAPTVSQRTLTVTFGATVPAHLQKGSSSS